MAHAIHRSTLRAVWAVGVGTLVVSAALTPQVIAPGTAQAAGTCASSVATYVVGPGSQNIAKKRTVHKYMDWGPKAGESSFFDTEATGQIAGSSTLVAAGQGVLYEVTKISGNGVKAYKDNTATGGALLTPVKTYTNDWSTAKRVWSNGSRIFVVTAAGALEVYEQTSPSTGAGTLTKVAAPGATAAWDELAAASDVWMVGSVIYTLTGDTIAHRTYSETTVWGKVLPALTATVTDKTGLTGVTQAWSPGPGAINTLTSTTDPDSTGRISKYATGPFAALNDDVKTGIVGDAMADTASCLSDPDPDVVPYFGTPAADETDLPTAQEPTDGTAQPSNTVTGKFTLGNGQPAAGLKVSVTAPDTSADTGATTLPVLGVATTAADGTWSLTLPATLPADVQQAATDNGGALNLSAMASGTSATGVKVLGVDSLTAVPVQTGTPAAAEDISDGHTVPLIPNTVDDTSVPDPTPAQEQQSYAAQTESDPQATDAPTPMWQSDHGTLAADYNPYLVNGKDISTEGVTPYSSGSCSTVSTPSTSKIKYTVVGEAHANWDAKATFDYDNSMSSSIDTAVNSNGNWKLGGTKQVSSETGVSTGFTNRGSYWAHQYKVPINYTKYKRQSICSGTVRATWYVIEPTRYKVPSGGSVGQIGKDVSSKDGSVNYSHSTKSHRAKVEPGTYFQLSHKTSAKFGGAVNFMGVGLGVTTGYDQNHKQKITAGSRTNAKHLIWGKNGPVSDKPGVFYSN